jgi:hypothetical protein
MKRPHLQKGEYKEEEITEEMGRLNENLLENENFELPNNYKKYHEKNLNFNYQTPLKLLMQIPVSYTSSYSILSDLCHKLFR